MSPGDTAGQEPGGPRSGALVPSGRCSPPGMLRLRPQIEGWGRGMAPLVWLAVLRRLPVDRRRKRHPASPRPLFAGPEQGALNAPDMAADGVSGRESSPPVPCAVIHPLRDGPRNDSWPWLRCSFPQDLFARPHRPRAVEHRDCPPCGGDGEDHKPASRASGISHRRPTGFLASGLRVREKIFLDPAD